MWYQFSREASFIVLAGVQMYRQSIARMLDMDRPPFPWDRDSLTREILLVDAILEYLADMGSPCRPQDWTKGV